MSVSEILTIGDKKRKAKRSSDLLSPSVSARFLLAEPPSPKETASNASKRRTSDISLHEVILPTAVIFPCGSYILLRKVILLSQLYLPVGKSFYSRRGRRLGVPPRKYYALALTLKYKHGLSQVLKNLRQPASILFRSEYSVARVAESGKYISVLVQTSVERRYVYLYVGVFRMYFFYSLGGSDYRKELDMLATAFL